MVWPPSSETLDAMRHAGDPAADERVAGLDRSGVEQTMKRLFASATLADAALTDDIALFPYEPPSDIVLVNEGQQVFLDHGPEILWLLGCYALPAAYAAKNGVEVLAQTGFLGSETDRRLIETTFMVVDVMTEGGLDEDGTGTQTIDRVRVMHAAIRSLILQRTDEPWDTEGRGLPLNQEDMAGTLMTFSALAVDGLRKIGIRLTKHERDAFTATWAYIGRRMGVDPQLIPDTYRQAKQLTKAIQSRQIDPSATSRRLTAALVPVLERRSLPGVPTATMRLCLPRPVWKGLGLHGNLIMDILIRVFAFVMGWIDRVLLRFKRRSRLFRAFSMGLINELLNSNRDEGRPQYELPESLKWWQTDQLPVETPTARVFRRATARLGPDRPQSLND